MATPRIVPTVVPTRPISTPSAMKTRVILFEDAPSARSTPISRRFSATIRIRWLMIANAATKMIRVRITNIAVFSAIQLEKTAMFVILTLIIFVAAFAIISHLILMVAEKRREIGVLRALGASSKSITLVFMAEGVLIGLVGTTVGTILGVAIGVIQDRYHLVKIPGDVYQLSELPMKMHPPELILIAVAALVLSFLATLYPSRQAARLHPVDVLRY